MAPVVFHFQWNLSKAEYFDQETKLHIQHVFHLLWRKRKWWRLPASVCFPTSRSTVWWEISCVHMSPLLNDWSKHYQGVCRAEPPRWSGPLSWKRMGAVWMPISADARLSHTWLPFQFLSVDSQMHIRDASGENAQIHTYTQTMRGGGGAPLSLASRCVTARL